MLIPFSETDGVANIVGIDPGSMTLGLCVLSLDVTTLEIVHTQAQTFYGDKLPYFDKHVAGVHGERIARILAHKQNILNILIHYKPIAIASESPFFNMKRPNAFAALLETMSEIRNAVIEYNPRLSVVTIDPPTVKKAVGAAGNADKIAVQTALYKIADQLKFIGKEVTKLDEHSIDAVAVAYCCYKSIIADR